MFIFTPFMNSIFGSTPVALGDIGLAILVGASILPVISVEKLWRNRTCKKTFRGLGEQT
jgi:TRAP-type C4-dicarboxylate transport system permease small subunit